MPVRARCRALVASVDLVRRSAGRGSAVPPGERAVRTAPPGLETRDGRPLGCGLCAGYATTDGAAFVAAHPCVDRIVVDHVVSEEAPADA